MTRLRIANIRIQFQEELQHSGLTDFGVRVQNLTRCLDGPTPTALTAGQLETQR